MRRMRVLQFDTCRNRKVRIVRRTVERVRGSHGKCLTGAVEKLDSPADLRNACLVTRSDSSSSSSSHTNTTSNIKRRPHRNRMSSMYIPEPPFDAQLRDLRYATSQASTVSKCRRTQYISKQYDRSHTSEFPLRWRGGQGRVSETQIRLDAKSMGGATSCSSSGRCEPESKSRGHRSVSLLLLRTKLMQLQMESCRASR